MSDAELAAVSDGRVFTGRQGLPLKLIDAYGGEREAVAWLESERGLPKDLPVRKWEKPGAVNHLGLFSLAGQAAAALGYEGVADVVYRIDKAGSVTALDGLLAIWQADPRH
jgi:protease-4